jgi:FkbM family methyltransferase
MNFYRSASCGYGCGESDGDLRAGTSSRIIRIQILSNWTRIPLEHIVPAENIQRTITFDLDFYIYESIVRSLTLRWLAPTKRLLWMAAGIEYIEPELLNWIDRIPKSSVYYDLGASNGIFAVYAAKRGLNVVAIEPDPSNFFLLSWNTFLNCAPSVHLSPFNVAASDHFAAGELFIRKMELGAHEKVVSQALSVSGETFRAEYVHPIQLVHFDKWVDLLRLPKPQYLKIDVDGHEIPVLHGASRALRNCEQIFIEIEDSKYSELDYMLRQLGLTLVEKYQVQNYEGLWNCIYTRLA